MLSVVAILLILGIAFFHALQGLFSALLMLVCTVACTMLAFNYYESLAEVLYSTKPAHAEAIALIAMLILPLLALRLLLDRFLRGNVVPNMWVDRIGGGVFGLLVGMLLVGTLLIAVQMLPFGREIFGYDPYDDNLQASSTMPLDAPAFTLGLVKTVSAGSFSGDESFAKKHDNLILELWGTRNRPAGARAGCEPKSMSVLALYDVTTANYPGHPNKTFAEKAPPYPTAKGAAGRSRVLVGRVAVSVDAQDSDRWWRLSGTQFRLVTTDGGSFFPVGYLVYSGGLNVFTAPVGALEIARPSTEGREVKGQEGTPLVVDLLYRIPFAEGSQTPPAPWFLAFRRHPAGALPEIETIDPAKMAENIQSLQKQFDAEQDAQKQLRLSTQIATAMAEATPAGQLKRLAKLALRKQSTPGKVPVILPEDVDLPFTPERARAGRDLPLRFRRTTPTAEDAPYGDINTPNGRLRWGWVRGDEVKIMQTKGSKREDIRKLWLGDGTIAVFLEDTRGHKKTAGLPAADKVTGSFMQPTIVYDTPDGVTYQRPAAGAWVRWLPKAGEIDGHLQFHSPLGSGLPAGSTMRLAGDPHDLTPILKTYVANAEKLKAFGIIFVVPEKVSVVGFHLTTGGPLIACKTPLLAKEAK